MKKGSTGGHAKSQPFNAKQYAKNGLSEDEVNEVKEAFDLFDIEGSGSINPKGTIFVAYRTQGLYAKSGI